MKRNLSQIISITLTLALSGCAPAKQAGKIKSNEPFSFFVLGDWGMKGQYAQQKVANAMIAESQKHAPDMIVTVGDNFYDIGPLSLTDDHWQTSYEQVYRELTTKYP